MNNILQGTLRCIGKYNENTLLIDRSGGSFLFFLVGGGGEGGRIGPEIDGWIVLYFLYSSIWYTSTTNFSKSDFFLVFACIIKPFLLHFYLGSLFFFVWMMCGTTGLSFMIYCFNVISWSMLTATSFELAL